MPLGRNARQQRPRPPKYKNNAYVPRVDVFGTLKLSNTPDTRGRLIEYAPDAFAFFTPESIESPLTFQIDTPLDIKGRVFRASVQGAEMRFQKAGCGCETPYELRVGRTVLIRNIPQVQELLAPDTGNGALFPQEIQAGEPVLERDNEMSAFIETFPDAMAGPQ